MKTAIIKKVVQLSALSAVAIIAGCSSPDHSRNLNDPSISANTTAMQVCSTCHGMRGVTVSPNFPNLAAQTKPYLINQLTEFRSHQRSDPEGYEYMWGISSHLTDAQIDGLADYFSNLPATTGNVGHAGTPEQIAEGRTIFETGISAENVPACVACHGAHAAGNDQFPRLAGQHADYLVKQLMVFQRTDKRPAGVAMKAVTHNLSPQSMASVAAFLETLPATQD